MSGVGVNDVVELQRSMLTSTDPHLATQIRIAVALEGILAELQRRRESKPVPKAGFA